jgi:hypothetical protein
METPGTPGKGRTPTTSGPILSDERLRDLVLRWRMDRQDLALAQQELEDYEKGSDNPLATTGSEKPFVPSLNDRNAAALAHASAGELSGSSSPDDPARRTRTRVASLQRRLSAFPYRLLAEGMPENTWVACGERSYLVERRRTGARLREALTPVARELAGRHDPATVEWRSAQIER